MAGAGRSTNVPVHPEPLATIPGPTCAVNAPSTPGFGTALPAPLAARDNDEEDEEDAQPAPTTPISR